MSQSLHALAIPGFIDMLTNMSAWLDKASAQGDEAALIGARLAPDMLPLVKQYQIASDSAKGAAARLTGAEAPAMPDTEASFAELKARCDKTVAYLKSIDPAAFDAGAGREVEVKFPNGGGMRFGAVKYLTGFAIPNFYFHATAAYAILRAQGIELGKGDYLAGLAPYMFAPPQPAET
jgi:hypothetical protein